MACLTVGRLEFLDQSLRREIALFGVLLFIDQQHRRGCVVERYVDRRVLSHESEEVIHNIR